MELREVKTDSGWKVEIVQDDRSISRLWIVDRQMRIGPCPVYVGGIAGVGTDRDYRHQGLSRRVLEASNELMRREGYDASFLFGIRDFYDKFGFATCMPERLLHLDTRHAERAEKQLATRPMRKGDFAQIARIYNRDHAERTASIVRDRRWSGFPMGSDFGYQAAAQVVLDASKRVCGYIAYDQTDDHVRAAEIGGQGPAVFGTILHFLARRAIQLRREELSFSIAEDHPFARYCRSYGCRAIVRAPRNAGPMGRLINLPTFLDKIRPVLAERWGSADRQRVVALKTDIGTGVLRWQRGALTLRTDAHNAQPARVDQAALMQMAMGYQTATDLKTLGRLKANAATLALLERLFPLQTAHMSWPDRF